MSLSTMRKNFYRIATLIIDRGADAMRCLLDNFIKKIYRISFGDFVSHHQHELYHQLNNNICCQCPKHYRRPCKTVISVWQMDTLFDKNSPKHSNHRHSSKCEYCCSAIKPNLKLDEIDITLLRYFLVTYFEQEFWHICLNGGVSFKDFLNTNKHDIFHLVLLNTPCCLCFENPEYKFAVATGKDISKHQWGIMFSTPNPHYIHNKTCLDDKNPCSVTAATGIRPLSLDIRTRITLLSKFCIMMEHTDQLVQARNTVFAHAIKGELSDEYFRKLWNEIENSIIYLSQITSTDLERTRSILELREKSLEESMCLEIQCLALRQTKGDETVIEEIRKNAQQTVESVEAKIDVKLQEVQSQITILETNIKNMVGKALSEYSDAARNIIENTRIEIEDHDANDTYVKTSAVTAGTNILRTKNLLIIIGKSGIGKSSTALAIASALNAKGNMVMKLEHDSAKDFKRCYNRQFKQLIIFEDFLGQSDVPYCSKKHANILKVLAPHVRRGKSKFIITIRTYKIEDAADEIIKCNKLFSNGAKINLNGEFSLSTTEKENILKLNAIKHKINICKKYNTKTLGSKILHYNEFENIIGTDPYLGFPEACHLFCSCDNLFAMGYKFFSSPSEKLLDEIRELRITGYDHAAIALQYCVLTSLMLDTVCKISIGIRKGIIPRESHESLSNLLNINCSMIEFLYRLLYKKEITVTTNDIHDICNKVSEKYVTKEFDRKRYVFLHSTVRDAVLLSYWHKSTMDDIIKYCSVDILLEYIRTWDCAKKGHGGYLFVPKSKCKTLVQRLFDICLVCKGAIILCSIVIEKSEFTLNLLNQKLTEWCCTEANVINCGLSKLKKFIRPVRYKNENNRPCAHADENWIIERLINELKKLDCQVKFVRFYIQYYGCDEFVENFNTKLTLWLKSDTNEENCKWKIFKEFVRPTTFKIEKGKMRAFVEDTWIIKRLIHELMTITFDGILDVIWYIKKYGCEEFIRNFNETFSQWLKLEENLLNCNWIVVTKIVRPTSFKIESGKIYANTSHNLLSQRLISELMKTGGDRILDVQTYIQKFCSDNFVTDFKEHLTEWLQSKENVVNIELNVLYEFVRPKSFKIGSGEIRGHTNDNWLSQRLIKEFSKTGGDRITDLQTYVKKYGSNTFVTIFTENLTAWLQTEENVVNCELNVLYEFVRPTSFKIGSVKIRAHTNDNWLATRLLDQLLKVSESRLSAVHRYIKKYGSDKFVKILNSKLTEWLQSRENLILCKLNVLYELVRPTSFRIENGIIGASTNDNWLTEILIDQFLKPEVCTIWKEQSYIKKFGNDDFIRYFNKKFTERLQLHANVKNCKWVVIFELVRPSSYRIESGEIGATTKDNWLTQRLISELVSPDAKLVLFVIDYIKEFGSKQFVNDFNTNLTIWLQSVENVNKSKWDLLFQTINQTAGTLETGDIEVPTTDSWLIQRLVYGLVKSEFEMENVRRSIQNYGSDYFSRCFNLKLHAWILQHLKTCEWQLFKDVVRPSSFSYSCDDFFLCVDDIQVVEYLCERLHHRSDAFSIKRYIQKYGSDEFIVKFNKMLQTKLNYVGEGTTWERLEQFYKDSDGTSSHLRLITLDCTEHTCRVKSNTSSIFGFSKILSRIRPSNIDFEYVNDDHGNSNDDSEDSTYETDEYFDSCSDSDLDETNDVDVIEKPIKQTRNQ